MHGKVKKVISIVSVFFILGLVGCHRDSDSEKLKLKEVQQEEKLDKPAQEKADNEDSKEKAEDIYVHVCGQVQNPGVYRLKSGSRIFAALEAAGGVLEAADAESLNQAEVAADGQRVYVPAQGEAVKEAVTNTGDNIQPDDGKVNLNTASKEELMTLNGIGEARAGSILKYREEQGGFQTVEQLKEIEGIKDGIFNKIKDQVKTG